MSVDIRLGLRPVQEGEMRIEKQRAWVGRAGYQCSDGCAQAAVDLVER